jgi:alpha-ketoglutarate-dependent taurine dioxygenase
MIEVRPLEATFGARVTGARLAALQDSEFDQILAAFHQYALLIFPDQPLTRDEQTAFGQRFGDIEALAPGRKAGSVPLSNQKPGGRLAIPDDHAYKVLAGNEGWHTDSTYMPLASKAAILSARVVPPAGGETEWADMRAAWDALPAEQQAELEGLSAYHSLFYSQARSGFAHHIGDGYGYHDQGRPLRAIVKTHPVTGVKALYTGRHAHDIPGMDPRRSEALLDTLLDQACQAPRTYLHRWRPGDLALWDNRCLMHRARPYDKSQPRVLIGTRIAGDRATELASTHRDPRASALAPSQMNG